MSHNGEGIARGPRSWPMPKSVTAHETSDTSVALQLMPVDRFRKFQ